jgi:type IV pilus assembly protein PilW
MKHHRECHEGFTLVELMIAVAISGVVLAAIYQMFIGQQRSYSLQNDIAGMQQEVRASEYMMVREIRMAGYQVNDLDIRVDVPGAAFSNGAMEAFEEATSQSIAFTTDADGDGKMETIRYSLEDNSLMREMWRWEVKSGKWKRSGGARTLSDSMEQLEFVYGISADDEGLNNDQDDDGDRYADEEGELLISSSPGREEREHLRTVRLTLTAKSSRPDPHYSHPLGGDHFRRITLSSMVQVRNGGL